MHWISIFFLIISFLYAPNVFAGPDDFFEDFNDIDKLMRSINIPANQTHLYTVLDTLTKQYWVKVRAIYETTTILEDIARTSSNPLIEVENMLKRVVDDITITELLDAPKNKALDLAGKMRNEAVHQRLEFLRQQEKILRDAKDGINKAIDTARKEGVGILAALDRDPRLNDLLQKKPHYNTSYDPPHSPTPTPSNKMRDTIARQAKKGTRNAFPVDADSLSGLFPSDADLEKRFKPYVSAPLPTPQAHGFFRGLLDSA